NQGKYRLIFEANRDKLTDENSLQVGQELVIPPLPGAGTPGRRPAPASPARPTAMRHYREVGLTELPGHLRRRWHVVRPGDRLTDIARRQMNDGSVRAVQRLYEANRDRIADPDVLPVGLRLRIPR
ncbi:MAG: LysM peptidoglycan-binding domain-containing protein, partial [Planctomycetota bacterium]